MNEEEARLRGLIEHWAHHNDEHKDRFLEAASEAEGLGFNEAAAEMKQAASEANKVSVHLRKALGHMGDR